MSWLGNAIKTCGRTVKSGIKTVAKVTGDVGKKIEKVPVVGTPLGAVYNLSVANQWKLAGNIASGVRPDKAFGRFAKGIVGSYEDLAPYAQTIVSTVPGVGQGISGAIGCGLALANGQPISKALVEAVKAAVPGGPLAQSAFSAACAVAEGKSIDEITIAAMPLPPEQKKLLLGGLKVAQAAIKGDRVDNALFEQVKKQLPPNIGAALEVGIAVGKGKSLQTVVARAIDAPVVKKIGDAGLKAIASNAVLNSAKAGFKTTDVKAGFTVGIGLAQHKVKPVDVVALRQKLKPEQRKGFDIALSVHTAMVTQKPPKKAKNPEEQFGYYATVGMRGATVKRKTAMMATVIAQPAARLGAELGIRQIKEEELPWWKRIIATVKDAVEDVAS